jgi:hypothetical protein
MPYAIMKETVLLENSKGCYQGPNTYLKQTQSSLQPSVKLKTLDFIYARLGQWTVYKI